MHTLWKSSPAVWLPFSSSPSEPLGETSQLQSHLPPLSPRLIHHITSSLKPLFPWQPGVTHSGPWCRLHEQHADENLPKAPASYSASAQPVQARTPRAVHGPVRYNMLYTKFMTCGRESVDILSVVADISMMGCYNHATWSGILDLNPKQVSGLHTNIKKLLVWCFFSVLVEWL